MGALEKLRKALKTAREALEKHMADHDGDLTEDQVKERAALMAKVKAAREAVKMQEEVDQELASESNENENRTVPAEPKSKEKPFKTFGDQLVAIAQVGLDKDATGRSDQRLIYQKAAGANETVASEGGFLVQEDFSTALLDLVHESSDIMGRVTNIPISSNSNALRMPIIDERSRARGSRWGGVRAVWLAEGEQKVDSKPSFGEISLGLNKLAALGYATDELLQDATALEVIMKKAFSEEIRFEVEDSIFNGSGAGKPLGILNSGAIIVVNKESSQAAGTITFQNLVDMMDRMPLRSRRNAVWVTADSGVEAALYSVMLPGGAGHPVFLPPGQNMATPGNAAYGTLLGKPVIPVEYLPALGMVGDIMLVDFSEYITITKGGIQAADSMHVRFVYDEMCFRMVYRIDGKPAWSQPVTTANGATTKSPFIALQTRS